MYNLYKTVHSPTSVDHAVYCNFLNAHEENLITANVNRLHVYKLNSEYDKQSSRKLKFECLKTFTLFGNVSAIAKCRYGSMNKDALILAFMDAKLAIVEYNPQTADLNTLSMHYFETDSELVSCWIEYVG